ncbi:MAG: protease inhibitor I42 family protein, partial [Verrucomicrobia bacterium]|nr:protease inhibitor I42 family protein [Verrucomicrobiota bacterium]
ESWIFKATTPGQTLLTFSLARSWEKNVSPMKTVQFDITVE